jgi:hypothetical protein
MEHYKQEIKNTLADIVADGYETRAQVLKRWEEGDTQNDFGNIDGSRFCNAWKAKEALAAAGFPFNDEINELFEEVGYNVGELLNRGPEVVDVIICELLAPQVAAELMAE